MSPRQNAAIRLLKIMLVATIAIPATAYSYACWVTYHNAFAHADEQISASLDVLSEQAVETFQSVDLTFASVNALIGDLPDDGIKTSEQALHLKLKDLAAALTAVDTIWIFDKDGHPLVASSIYPAPRALDVSRQDYFVAQVGRNAGTFIGAVARPLITQDLFIGVSRRRPLQNGQFSGAVVVAVLPRVFTEFFDRLAGQTTAGYTLVRADGVILARRPAAPAGIDRFGPDSGFMRITANNPQGGLITAMSINGSERRIGLRKLDYPGLYSTAGLEINAIYADWLRMITSHLFFGIPATIFLFGLVLMTLRRTREFYAEAERRELAEQALRQAQKMEAVGQLTGGVAHDFNNLLTIIIGNISIAKRGVVEARAERALDNAMSGAERAAQLTQRLLAFSRRQPLDPRAVDANKLILSMSDLLTRSLGENVKVETISGAGLWNIEVDVSELEATLLNLALNARDAMTNDGKLTIETSNAYLDDEYCRYHDGVNPGQYVMIAITDNGSGMAPETIEKAFEPFFTTKETGKGSGLGLSQVYGFIKQSGGHIKIYSELGEGTTIKLYLPRHDIDDAIMPLDEQGGSESGHGETILIVEDDEGVRQYASEILRDLSYQIIEAKDSATALRLVEAGKKFDLLLTDVVLPGKNGREMADEIERLRPGIKIIFMTGYSRNAIVHHGRLDRDTELIVKPLIEQVLARKIRQVLDASAAS